MNKRDMRGIDERKRKKRREEEEWSNREKRIKGRGIEKRKIKKIRKNRIGNRKGSRKMEGKGTKWRKHE